MFNIPEYSKYFFSIIFKIFYSIILKISYYRMVLQKQPPAYQLDQSLPISLVTPITRIAITSHKLPLRERVTHICQEELCLVAVDQNHSSLNSLEEPKGLMWSPDFCFLCCLLFSTWPTGCTTSWPRGAMRPMRSNSDLVSDRRISRSEICDQSFESQTKVSDL